MENELAGDFEGLRDIIKILAAEVENVTEMHGQVKTDDTLASVSCTET